MWHLVTFGGLRLEGDGATAAPQLRRSWLAMLAVLAAAGDRGIPRERFVAIFWPESDEEHARQSARQALYSVRQAIGGDVVRSSGSSLALDPAVLSSDVAAFKAALAAGDRVRAVAHVASAFLDGFTLPGAPAFQRWAEDERSRIQGMRTAALLALAADATRDGRTDEAVARWRELTDLDPLDGRHAVGYLKALAARGDRATALAFVRKHEAAVREELKVDPDPDVRRLEVELRAMPWPVESAWVARAVPPLPALMVTTTSPRSPTETDQTSGRVIAPRDTWRRGAWRTGIAAIVVFALALLGQGRDRSVRADEPPVFAVGVFRELGAPDSARDDGVLTDMLATNLARIPGLHVLSNSRLLSVLRPGPDTSVAYADAARRAGASDLLEGHLMARADGMALALRRVDLVSGMVSEAITVTAVDRVALVDSMTAELARRLRLTPPTSSVAGATTTSATAYRLYDEGLRAYYREDVATARQLMRAALVEDTSFAMAAFYEALLAPYAGDRTPDGRHATAARATALRLAQRAPARERLMITANVLVDDADPAAFAVAESLATRYPEDPDSHHTLGRARHASGDWRGAVDAFNRAIAMDSAVGVSKDKCRACEHLSALVTTYLWFDSLDAAARTAHRYRRFRDEATLPAYWLAIASARQGDSTATDRWAREVLASGSADRAWRAYLDLRLERYDDFERDLPQLLWSSSLNDKRLARWYHLISLRNQGRLREALVFSRDGRVANWDGALREGTPDRYNDAILALSRGDGRVAAQIFEAFSLPDASTWSRGYLARHQAWYGTLAGMARAAAGDTARVRVLADSVQLWGSRSSYGRDRRAHHYLRGLLHVAAGRDEAAAAELRQAVHSPSLGFTRVNFELGGALLRLGRAQEAVAAVQPALRGDLDASNLYITRTELHELLATAFDTFGQSDSAAVHYAAVVRAWRRADPAFQRRREHAAARLAALASR